jgi:tetratricopeptide (TPR) repeat protein
MDAETGAAPQPEVNSGSILRISDRGNMIRLLLLPFVAAAGLQAQPLPNEARMQEQIKKYERIVADNPRDIEFWHELAVLYREAEMWDKAIAADSEAIKRHPKYAAAIYSRGKALFGKGDYLGSLTDFNEAIRLFEVRGGMELYLTVEQPPESYIDAYRTRGVAFSHLGKYAEAVSDLGAAAKLRKDDPKLLYEKGYIEEKAGRKKEAVADLHRAGMIYADGYGRKSAEDCASRLDALGAHGEAGEIRRKMEPKAKSDLPQE